jgi:two-component system LytT family response regulator
MTDRRKLRVLIADDEPLARQRIEDMLLHEPDVEIVGMADNGNAAVEAIRSLAPDLVFLDIQMPGRTGLDVVRAVGVEQMPATIFVTAYDQHAIAAFDVAALDYLVKPFDDERFEQAFRRARRVVELEQVNRLRTQLIAALGAEPIAVAAAPQAPSDGYLERFAVETRGKVRVIPVDDVLYIVASGPYAELFVADRKYLIREAMQTLEDRLDPRQFIRVHRSAIVRISLIDTLLKSPGGDYEIVLKNGAHLRVSRSRREALERAIGVG